MKNYVGIDLGTTNSAIASYDGSVVRIWKSPEQNDVTPSVIYIDRRGNKYIGKRAYDTAPHSPDNAASLFKRLMGTSTPVRLPALNRTLTPEQCSAEVLRVLFGYLPEELRNDTETGTVITVPAAFNQMQKNATTEAADLAGIGRVALMQEPVAAVMSVMRARDVQGIFLIYDLGGGTLDVALAERIGGRVSLLSHGGISMCGGRDFDRMIVDHVVKPWLFQNFELPDDLTGNPNYKGLIRLAAWATERAKVELSAQEHATISLSEAEARVRDEAGTEIYIEIPINRTAFDNLIDEKLKETIDAVRETLFKAGIGPHDVTSMVFIGGPTSYKPLRDKIAFELGVETGTDVNPMTAVAEGAAIFAESIDWGSDGRSRKSNRGRVASIGDFKVAFNYTARTPDTRAKVVVQLEGDAPDGFEFQTDSIDTGWTSGRLPLMDGTTIELQLPKYGENQFQVFVFDSAGGRIKLEHERIAITRTAASVDAIPASHSVGVEVLDRLGGTPTLAWLVCAGDELPKRGKCTLKAGESLKAGSSGALNFRLLEGKSNDPADNRFIGLFQINGSDFDDGVIPAGGDLHCEFEMMDSGHIVLEVSAPDVRNKFHSGRNFYSPQEGKIDYSSQARRVREEGERTLRRVEEIGRVVDDDRLDRARTKLTSATTLDPEEPDSERTHEAMENVYAARNLLAGIRSDRFLEMRKFELEKVSSFFNEYIRQYAKPSERTSFDNLIKTATNAGSEKEGQFRQYIRELNDKIFHILWRQDWFVLERFKWIESSPHHFSDPARFQELMSKGRNCVKNDDIEGLRRVVAELTLIQMDTGSDTDMLDVTNIIRG